MAVSGSKWGRKFGLFVGALTILLIGPVQANNVHSMCEGFLPPNNARVPVGATFMGEPTGINQQQFNAVLDRVKGLYTKEIQDQRKANFVIVRDWVGDTVNAYATQTDNGKTWSIHMFGGLARYKGMSEDGFAAVACHEVGHHLGGAPKFTDDESGGLSWGTIEGEADYYAMLKCLRRYFEFDDNEKVLAGMKLNEAAVKSCHAQFSNHKDALICIRSAHAGIVLGEFMQKLSGDRPVSISTPDASRASGIDPNHPAAQCRLDTYYLASLCTVAVWEQRSDTDHKPGSCFDKKLTSLGLRPRCWFNP